MMPYPGSFELDSGGLAWEIKTDIIHRRIGFPGCVSSLTVSISSLPRILPVRLESSF
jgi:hypothetical protein